MIQGQQQLRGVETRTFFGEMSRLAQVVEERAAVVVVRHEVELVFRLEGVAQPDDERMAHFEQDVAFGLRVLDLSLGGDDVLLEHLHRVHFALVVRVLLAHQHDLAEGALADDLQQIEVGDGQLLFLGLGRGSGLALATGEEREDAAGLLRRGRRGRRRRGRRPRGRLCFHGLLCCARVLHDQRGVVFQAVVAGHDHREVLGDVAIGLGDGQVLEDRLHRHGHARGDVDHLRDTWRQAQRNTRASQRIFSVGQAVAGGGGVALQVHCQTAQHVANVARVILLDDVRGFYCDKATDSLLVASSDQFLQEQVLAERRAVAEAQQNDAVQVLCRLQHVGPNVQNVDLGRLRALDGHFGRGASLLAQHTVGVGPHEHDGVPLVHCAVDEREPSSF
eukprot:gene5782-gene6363